MKHKTNFDISAVKNKRLYLQYLNRLTELAISMFEWENLPDSIDARFLELTLFSEGKAIFFYDEAMGYLTLKCLVNGGFNVYQIPVNRRAFAINGYNRSLNEKDSVIIWNNFLHQNTYPDVELYAYRLYNIDSIIDVNANAQKTPILIQASETQRLTLLNMYKEYDGNAPVIFGDKNLDINALKVLKTDAPFLGLDLLTLKTEMWNEAPTYLGISNVNMQKKERLIQDEVARNQGGTVASRYSRLMATKQACEEINKMFGLNIDCKYREDFEPLAELYEDKVIGGDTLE